MPKKIEVLPEQEAQIPAYIEKWREIGLSTEPLNLEVAVRGAKLLYIQAKRPLPAHIYTAQSPWQGLLMQIRLHLILMPGELATQAGLKLMPGEARDQGRSQAMPGKLATQVGPKLMPAQSELVASLDGLSKQDIKTHGFGLLHQALYGSQDAFWLAFYNFFLEVVGVQDCNKLQGLFDIAQSCGWWIPHEEYIIFQDRPNLIRFDDQKRLHNPIGPALSYRDGDAIYAWHGTRIPPEWINPGTLTASEALSVRNQDERLAACEILGWENILKELDAVELDRHPNPQVGILVEVVFPDPVGKQRFVRVCETADGKGRMFALGVRPDCKTALEGVLSTFSLPADESLVPALRL